MSISLNELEKGTGYHKEEIAGRIDWTTEGLCNVRLRMLSDAGHPYWDVSYCHGYLMVDGVKTKYRINIPFDRLPKRGVYLGNGVTNQLSVRQLIVNYAREDKVFAKGIGILDGLSLNQP